MRRYPSSGLVLLLAATSMCGAAVARDDLQKPPATLPTNAPKLSPLVPEEVPWAKQRQSLLTAWRDYLGEFPKERAPMKMKTLATEDLPGFTRQHVQYQIEEGVFTDGYLLTPKNVTGKLPAVVVFHATVATQAKQPAGVDESKPELMIGVQLVKRGYVVLCPRCFIFAEGASYSEHVNTTLAKHPSWRGMTRMTFDAIRAADLLASLPNVDKERLGCIGHSLGAKEALYAAAFDERYKVCVFSEGGIGLRFSNWDAVWYLGADINKPGFALEHHQLMALIAPRAFLLLAGESADSDKSWPFIESVLPVYKLLGKTDNIGWLNHRQGHRYSPEAQHAAEEILDLHLKR